VLVMLLTRCLKAGGQVWDLRVGGEWQVPAPATYSCADAVGASTVGHASGLDVGRARHRTTGIGRQASVAHYLCADIAD
jgi:hypothetical protein